MPGRDGEIAAVVAEKLKRLNDLVAAKDMAIIDELWSHRGFELFGSEKTDYAASRDNLAAHFRELYAKPFRLSWVWEEPSITGAGDVAWFTVWSRLDIAFDDGRVQSGPYRLTGILERVAGTWWWRLFSGSEPAPPPAG